MVRTFKGTDELLTFIEKFERELEGDLDINARWTKVTISKSYEVDISSQHDIDFVSDVADEELYTNHDVLVQHGFRYDDLDGNTASELINRRIEWIITLDPLVITVPE